eukprot:399348-Prymnesium_polylepis.1
MHQLLLARDDHRARLRRVVEQRADALDLEVVVVLVDRLPDASHQDLVLPVRLLAESVGIVRPVLGGRVAQLVHLAARLPHPPRVRDEDGFHRLLVVHLDEALLLRLIVTQHAAHLHKVFKGDADHRRRTLEVELVVLFFLAATAASVAAAAAGPGASAATDAAADSSAVGRRVLGALLGSEDALLALRALHDLLAGFAQLLDLRGERARGCF